MADWAIRSPSMGWEAVSYLQKGLLAAVPFFCASSSRTNRVPMCDFVWGKDMEKKGLLRISLRETVALEQHDVKQFHSEAQGSGTCRGSAVAFRRRAKRTLS